MQLVKQTENWDCGVACLAMITGRTLDEVKKDFIPRSDDLEFKGLFLMETLQYLYKENYVATIYENFDTLDITSEYLEHVKNGHIHLLQKKDVIQHIESGLDAILCVPSLVEANALHEIVIHKQIIFDPSPIEQYNWIQIHKLLYGYESDDDFTAAFLIKSRIDIN